MELETFIISKMSNVNRIRYGEEEERGTATATVWSTAAAEKEVNF